MAFRLTGGKNLIFNKRPALVTHTNDISIHFQTTKDQGVIFATSNVANNDYMKAYMDGGHVYVDTFIERAGGEVHYKVVCPRGQALGSASTLALDQWPWTNGVGLKNCTDSFLASLSNSIIVYSLLIVYINELSKAK